MKALRIVLGFLPFLVFSILAPVVGAGWSAAAGTLVAVVVVLATARDGIQIPPAAQGSILLVMAVLGFTGGPGVNAFLTQYGPGLCGVLLGYFLVATAATMPFTAQIARASVPAQFWHSPRFLEVNRRISNAWGLAVMVLGFCHVAGAEISGGGGALGLRLALNWVVPILVFWRVRAYSNRVAADAQHAAAAHGSHERTGS